MKRLRFISCAAKSGCCSFAHSSEESFTHLPKGVHPPRFWRGDPNRVVFKVRSWTDADTAILYVYSADPDSRSRNREAAFLFTLKLDAEGNSKIVHALKVPKGQSED